MRARRRNRYVHLYRLGSAPNRARLMREFVNAALAISRRSCLYANACIVNAHVTLVAARRRITHACAHRMRVFISLPSCSLVYSRVRRQSTVPPTGVELQRVFIFMYTPRSFLVTWSL